MLEIMSMNSACCSGCSVGVVVDSLNNSMLIVAAILLFMIVAPNVRKKREEAFQE